MADLLPSIPDTSGANDGEPRVVGIDSEEADDVLAALSSNTARQLLTALHDEPGTPSDLADRVDTSLQNAQYHLGNLEDADVVRVIDTAYSAKGREMSVYGPTDQPLVVFAGTEEKETGLRAALSRLIGGLGAVAGASLLVQALAAGGLFGSTADGGGPATAEDDEDPTDDEQDSPTDDEQDSPADDEQDGTTDGESTEGSPDDGGDEDDVGTATDDGGDSADAGENGAENGADAVEDADGDVSEDDGQAPADEGEDADPGYDVGDAPEQDGFDIPLIEDDGGLGVASGLPPGALFFAGGATVVIAWFVIWYIRIHRV